MRVGGFGACAAGEVYKQEEAVQRRKGVEEHEESHQAQAGTIAYSNSESMAGVINQYQFIPIWIWNPCGNGIIGRRFVKLRGVG